MRQRNRATGQFCHVLALLELRVAVTSTSLLFLWETPCSLQHRTCLSASTHHVQIHLSSWASTWASYLTSNQYRKTGTRKKSVLEQKHCGQQFPEHQALRCNPGQCSQKLDAAAVQTPNKCVWPSLGNPTESTLRDGGGVY